MTENKRFTIMNMGLDGRFIKEDGKIMEIERVVDLLNENEQLKSENKELIELIRHCYENWSEEKKKMVGEISNGLLGD